MSRVERSRFSRRRRPIIPRIETVLDRFAGIRSVQPMVTVTADHCLAGIVGLGLLRNWYVGADANACGTGRQAALLHELGCSTVGLDQSEPGGVLVITDPTDDVGAQDLSAQRSFRSRRLPLAAVGSSST